MRYDCLNLHIKIVPYWDDWDERPCKILPLKWKGLISTNVISQGPKLFNTLPKVSRNPMDCSVEKFK